MLAGKPQNKPRQNPIERPASDPAPHTHLYDDPDLSPRLAVLEKTDPLSLSVAQRCQLIQHIKNSVERRAQQHDLLHRNDKGEIIGLLPDIFEREEDALIVLLDSLSCSERFQDFFTRNAQALGRDMADMIPLHTLEQTWALKDSQQRQGMLQATLTGQFNYFAHDGLRFTAPPLKIIALPHRVLGQFKAGPQGLADTPENSQIEIAAAHNAIAPVHEIFKTVWHEGTHCLTHGFAAASYRGLIAPTNPFHADAQLLQARQQYRTLISARVFPRAYRRDPEERLAYDTERVFYKAWRDASLQAHPQTSHATRMARTAHSVLGRLKRLFL